MTSNLTLMLPSIMEFSLFFFCKFDHYEILYFVWTKYVILTSIVTIEMLVFQYTIRYALKFKHKTIYIKENNKNIIDAFNH